MQPPLPPETCAAEVGEMVKVIGQPIPDDVRPVIIKYLQTHFNPPNPQALAARSHSTHVSKLSGFRYAREFI